jgi:hypothetical protein
LRIESNDVETPRVDVPVTLHAGATPATFELDPHELNRSSNGRWAQGQITLPAGLDPHAIVTTDVRVQNVVPVDPEGAVSFTGQQVMYKFDRTELMAQIPDGDNVPVKVAGRIGDDTWFSGLELVRMHRPSLDTEPAATTYVAGTRVPLAWTDAKDHPASGYDLWYSANGGDSWTLAAGGLTRHDYVWTVPAVATENGLLELVAYDALGAMGDWFSRTLRVVTSAADATRTPLPSEFALRVVGPNPATAGTWVELAIPARMPAEVIVYDVRGARVRALARREFAPGWHRLAWDGSDARGRNAAAGVYFVRATAGAQILVTRIALTR